MRIDNNQQNTSFKANVIVCFPKPIENMVGRASHFAKTEGLVICDMQARKLDNTHVLVPDSRTFGGRLLDYALKCKAEIQKLIDNIKSLNPSSKPVGSEALSNAEEIIQTAISTIEHGDEVKRIIYKDYDY